MDINLKSRLEKMLALTSSPNENEAAAAMEMLQKLLLKHNLSIAELEMKGGKAPGVTPRDFDFGKAAFKWKLDLAETIASHFYCYPLVDRKAKTVQFVGRPDNVGSLISLYSWVIEQIMVISRNERYLHMERTGEHIDPLRFQVQFGIGIVERLGVRLEEIRRKLAEDANINALVVHHESEISDYLEEKFGYRVDGKKTKQQERWAEQSQARKDFKAECEAKGDMEPYYRIYTWERPPSEERAKELAAEAAAMNKEWERKQRQRERYRERNGYREQYHERSDEQIRKDRQGYEAREAGRNAAAMVNLQPFLNPGQKTEAI